MINFVKKYKVPLLLFFLFESVALILWLSLNKIFYLINFTYIGLSLTLGLALFVRGYKYARITIQFFIGSYMLVYLGIISQENMQIEGLFYYIYIGVFEAALIHYIIAKIIGPFTLYKIETKTGLIWYARFWNEWARKYAEIHSAGVLMSGKKGRQQACGDAAFCSNGSCT